VARGVDAARGDVVAAIATMVVGVAEEDARHGARAEFVRGRWCEVGVAEAAEDAELVVEGWGAEEELVWRHGSSGAARAPVDDVRRRVQGLRPKRRGSCTLD
jgi:hypothetical protein